MTGVAPCSAAADLEKHISATATTHVYPCSLAFACDLRYDLHVTFSDKYQYLHVHEVVETHTSVSKGHRELLR